MIQYSIIGNSVEFVVSRCSLLNDAVRSQSSAKVTMYVAAVMS